MRASSSLPYTGLLPRPRLSCLKKNLALASLTLAVCSFSVSLAAIYHPVRIVWIATWTLMALFFGYVSLILFIHLGRPGRITRGRLYVSVSLYFLLGIFYFAVFDLVDSIHPGSFVQAGLSAGTGMTRASHLLFSFVTLTTLRYGDIVPATPLARILAVLEAATGVLYIAITVARLVLPTSQMEERTDPRARRSAN